MAHGTVRLSNPDTGETISAPVGFSWPGFILPFVPAFARKDWVFFGVALLAWLFTTGNNWVFLVILDIMVGIAYNDRVFIRNRLKKGWTIINYFGKKEPEEVISYLTSLVK